MRICFLLTFISFLSACSNTPTESTTKGPSKPPEAITGRQAFQRTFPSARTWSADCQPLRILSLRLDELKGENGKAPAWEVTYVSAQQGRARRYTWSAIEAAGNLHEGVFAGPIESWNGQSGQQQPFLPASLQIDTTEAFATAVSASADYLQKPGDKPPVTFLLESSARFPNPTWRILWGSSISTAEYSVFVDATTGKLLQLIR
jgi:hypothetical protein